MFLQEVQNKKKRSITAPLCCWAPPKVHYDSDIRNWSPIWLLSVIYAPSRYRCIFTKYQLITQTQIPLQLARAVIFWSGKITQYFALIDFSHLSVPSQPMFFFLVFVYFVIFLSLAAAAICKNRSIIDRRILAARVPRIVAFTTLSQSLLINIIIARTLIVWTRNFSEMRAPFYWRRRARSVHSAEMPPSLFTFCPADLR